MPHYICITCGTQYPASDSPPQHCPVCEDERQYINQKGQQWTTLDNLRADHHNVIRDEEPRLTGIGTEPKFAIGQRALLVQSPAGNVLWDCISFIDDATVEAVQKLGGISAIGISHPHFYSSMIEWSHAFGNVPVYLHVSNRPYIMRPDPVIVFWEEDMHPLAEGITLVRCGGHFEGSTALHWAAGAEGRGVLLASDTIMVVPDRRWVSFMYSYPNLIPMPAPTVERIVQAVEPFTYDRIYSGWFDSVLIRDAKAAVARSAERYIHAIQGYR
jgi:glyoxylase-like metal-dependent hydrolase (beta-lactamase superfamily II)